jgi:hypothetical protein
LEYKGAVAPVVLLVNKKYAMTKDCEENLWDNYFMPTSTASCDLAKGPKGNSTNNFRLNCDLADFFADRLNNQNQLFADSKVRCVTNNGTTKEVFEKWPLQRAGVAGSLEDEIELNFTVSGENRAWHNGEHDIDKDKSIQTYYYGYVPIPMYYFNQSWHNRRR